ncbi:VanZ family protein [Luteimonas sp. FCS-9]|uniref:VanZ family protein n=1 Tax=Luteimonas sp. FCS-9 TaxID=1547516 RepID=UPI00063E71BA|nr:VanZ family protein [Luteimonas sp. FCS-9]KLJ00737.1 hypothetical protein WQ56_08040 [Luteimonas sp. FCS-9]
MTPIVFVAACCALLTLVLLPTRTRRLAATVALIVSATGVAASLVLPTPRLVALAGRPHVTTLEQLARRTPWELPTIVHFVAFAWLAWLLAVFCARWPRRHVVAVLVAMAIAAELLQGLSPGRTPRLTDVGVNLMGAATGLSIALAAQWVRRALGQQDEDVAT